MFCRVCSAENPNSASFCGECGRALTLTKTDNEPPTRDPSKLARGASLKHGQYQIESTLGEGGMGTVYLAWDSELERHVVIKIPHPSLLADPDFEHRFLDEIRRQTTLTHRGVAHVYGRGIENGVPFMVVQYLEGGSLRDWVDRDGSQHPDLVLWWLSTIAEALDFLHAQEVLHRDVKPDNILFDAHGAAYLGDFGITKVISETTAALSPATRTGRFVGTPAYVAPEYIDREFSPACDQYSLAVVVYHTLSGHFPHFAETSERLLVEKATKPAVPITEFAPLLPADVARVLMRALEMRPEDRFPSCQEFADRFSEAVRAPEPKPGRQGRRRLRHRRRERNVSPKAAWIIGSTAIVATAVAAAVWLVPWGEFEFRSQNGVASVGAPATSVLEPREQKPVTRDTAPVLPNVAAPPPLARAIAAVPKVSSAPPTGGPTLVSRTPEKDRLDVFRNAEMPFSIRARDPSGGELRYRWTRDGTLLNEGARDIVIRAREHAVIAVHVEDEAGNVLQHEWRVEVENRAPRISVTPGKSKLDLTLGEVVSFTATVEDADGDRTRISYHLDGRLIGSGPTLEYRAERIGRFELVARVEDDGKAVAETMRRLRVRPRAPSKPTKPTQATGSR